MKRFAARNIFLLIAIPIFLVLLLWEFFFFQQNSKIQETDRISQVFQTKEKDLNRIMDKVILRMKDDPEVLNQWSLLDLIDQSNSSMAITVSKGRHLLFWSSDLVVFRNQNGKHIVNKGLVHLPTGWFYEYTKKVADLSVHGYILIKREFPYQNRYINSAFQKDFGLPDGCIVLDRATANDLNIYGNDHDYLFTIKNNEGDFGAAQSDFSAILFFLLIIFLLAQLNVWIKNRTRFPLWLKLCFSPGIPMVGYVILSFFNLPSSIYRSNLFSPGDFAYNEWLASLGDFIFLSIFMFYLAQTFYVLSAPKKDEHPSRFTIAFSLCFTAAYFVFSVVLLKLLLINSAISLKFFSDLSFSFINLYAFFSISLCVTGFVIILLRMRFSVFQWLGFKLFVFLLLMTGGGMGVLVSYFFSPVDWMPFIYYALMVLIIAGVELEKIRAYKYTFWVIVSILGASYVHLYAQYLIAQKTAKVVDLLAVKLSSERDPAAEIFLSELDEKLQVDSLIQYQLMPPYKSLETYFQNNYFTGFWRNYNLQITVCNEKDSVFITDENRFSPSCFDFFDHLRKTKGVRVSGSDFYFMDRLNGRISYMGQLNLANSIGVPIKIFIELISKVIPEGKGYPELLLDEHSSRTEKDGGFSYAKYFDGQLVDRSGDYPYSMQLKFEVSANYEYARYTKDAYHHCAFVRNGNICVIVSYPENHFYQKISTFPYLFLLFYLIGLIVLLFNERNFKSWRRKLDLREKIQWTLILSLLIILSLIGVGLIYYNSGKLTAALQKSLNDKSNSVSFELTLRMGNENSLVPTMRDYLNDQLIVLSDIIRADINLYDLDGSLFATSRSEIYDRGLLSRRMNPLAFKAMSVDHKTRFLHNENLGEMAFFSVYLPVYNQNNKLLGYLNLPYFTGQDDYKKQISEFIVAFSNLYILLIMFSLVVALLISYKLTAPLLKIENNLKGIQLGKTNLKLDYYGEDEIGRLASAYNKKVDELDESAKLLARTERESAWQEMARQVAHEINNPLTPMKLSIQYLQRLKEHGAENFNQYFDRVSRTLIEQIDILSVIASSFSDFARMPFMKQEIVDLKKKLEEVVLLYENSKGMTVSLVTDEVNAVPVNVDKDQLGRAVINLIKNGMQAIPKDRMGRVTVTLYTKEKWAFISVADNGSGIPDGLKEKLFNPNFTTKSSGMGLGLAISKRIIEGFNGEIWFQSNHLDGTIFYIKLPLSEL